MDEETLALWRAATGVVDDAYFKQLGVNGSSGNTHGLNRHVCSLLRGKTGLLPLNFEHASGNNPRVLNTHQKTTVEF